jgi:hypothetical protein
VWYNLTRLNGGLVALHKTNWQAIAWELINGELTMMHATEHTIIVKDGKGAYANIDFIPSSEGVKGLDYRLSPSANQEPHHEATLKAVQQLCSCAVGAHMTPSEAVQAARQRLVPKLEYALKTTSFNKKQCKSYNTAPRKTFVAPMGLNRNYPGAVLHAPEEFGGMEFPNVEYL